MLGGGDFRRYEVGLALMLVVSLGLWAVSWRPTYLTVIPLTWRASSTGALIMVLILL